MPTIYVIEESSIALTPKVPIKISHFNNISAIQSPPIPDNK